MPNAETPSEPKFSFRPLRVFLCHASEDKDKVRSLRARLGKLTWVKTWLDEENIVPGEEWEPAITLSLQQSDVVIVCLSRHSVSKEGYVQKEIRYALDVADEKPEGTIFLIPLRLDDCDVPRRLHRWQWVDMFDEKGRGYKRLVTALRARANTVWASRNPSPLTADPQRDGSKSSKSLLEPQSRSIYSDRKIIIKSRAIWSLVMQKARKIAPFFAVLWFVGLALPQRYWYETLLLLPLLLLFSTVAATLDWLLKTPVLVIRHQHVDEFDLFAEYVVNFSIANRRGKPLIVNFILFRIGDYMTEAPPPFCAVGINTFERELRLEFVGHPDHMPFPLIHENRSEHSMGNATFALLPERCILGPYEQIDLWLVIKLRRPPQLKGKYPTVWKLGGSIQVQCEDKSLIDQTINYP